MGYFHLLPKSSREECYFDIIECPEFKKKTIKSEESDKTICTSHGAGRKKRREGKREERERERERTHL